MTTRRDLFDQEGHLTTETLNGVWKGQYDRNSAEGRRIASHLERCKHNCSRRLYAITRDDIVESYEKEEKHGVLSRISSFFYRFFGGNEPFHG